MYDLCTVKKQLAAAGCILGMGLFAGCCTVNASEVPGPGNYSKYADYTPVKAEPAEIVPGDNHHVLVAYFSRSGNTDISTDAVSSASLTVNDDGTAAGNAHRMAEWIAQETGGDLFLIQTEYTYPVNYDQTVKVGEGQDIDGYHPVLASHVENMEQYDTVYLVYPIWHYTLSVPACAFLDEYDLSGKTICAFAANAGSRFADSLERISEAEPDAAVIEGVSVSERDIDNAEETVKNRVREIEKELSDAGLAGQEMDQDMKLMIGDTAVTVVWEDNESVKELKEMASEGPVVIDMSMYGGFEQVGEIGSSLVSDDVQTVTEPGDIVLYADSRIVIFYGSNSWAYTRLGKITDCTNEELTALLGSGDVTITLSSLSKAR